MMCGIAQFSIEIPWSHSLKEKRQCLKSLRERARRKFNISCAEVAHHDIHNRGVFGVAYVASDISTVRHALQEIREFFESHPEILITNYREEII